MAILTTQTMALKIQKKSSFKLHIFKKKITFIYKIFLSLENNQNEMRFFTSK